MEWGYFKEGGTTEEKKVQIKWLEGRKESKHCIASCSSAGWIRPFSFVWISAPGFKCSDIFIFHAKINSSTFFISTYGTICWQNCWIYWGFPHITCRHIAGAGSEYRQPNNLVIALRQCCKEKWQMDVLSNSTSILLSRLKAVFCNFYGLK